MATTLAKILFIDDDVAVCEAVKATLELRFDVVCAHTGAAALAALARAEFEVVVSDLKMPGMTGLELCRRAHASHPNLPVVLVTAFGSLDTAVAAIRAGAYDFISKPIQVPELLLTLTRALDHRRLEQENRELRETVARQRARAEMIGESVEMVALHALLPRVGRIDATVLITGESGTGKELIAQAVHQRGPRSAGPFVAFNCAAIPDTMLESELFGHSRGAFTDARTDHKGLMVQANGGTLFLDEIGEMPPHAQVKLLRALQERKVRPVGGDREVSFDARIVAATSRDLEADVAAQRFREDLYYRINVIRIHVPPLRARGEDVLRLAEHFIQHFAEHFKKPVSGLSQAAADALLAYPWPGNVRELRNCIERAVALTQSDALVLEDLVDNVREFRAARIEVPSDSPLELMPMAEVERHYILRVLQALHGSKSRAALSLGFDRRTLYRKLKSYGIA
jgi:two-component system response regulator HydG